MKQKVVNRTSTFAWSPGQHTPLLATGTVAGAFDANFSNTSQLEIFDLNLGDKSPQAMELNQPVGVVSCSARFNRLAWAAPTVDRPYGMIAGGMENGELNLWDANAILNGSENVLYSRQTNHSGPVRGLHFNPFQQNLLSSASSNGEIFIWDLGNLSKPYTPGSRSAKLEDITCVSWNNHVQHILATSSTTGYTVVWDLKSKREVLTLSYPGAGGGSMTNLGQMAAGRRGITAVAWNPDVATQLITATEDDNNPVILVWDLRYAHAPEKILSGHSKGILSVSWCKQDSDLLLSAGKDCRSLCWNPSTGEIIGELPQSSSWTFDIDWCPRNPDLLASASFDGKINVYSIQSTKDSDSAEAALAHQEPHDPFAPHQFQTQQPSSTLSLKQPPKWLRRPVGAVFGFGGKLAIVRNRTQHLNLPPGAPAPAGVPTTVSTVTLANVITEPELVRRASELEQALETRTLDAFCENRSQSGEPTAEYWSVLRALFEANPREQLVHHLGFDKQDMVDQIASLTKNLQLGSVTSPKSPTGPNGSGAGLHRGSVDQMSTLFSGHQDEQHQAGEDAFSQYGSLATLPVSESAKAKLSTPFRIYPASDSDIDRKITRCIVAGDFDSAVNVCLHDDRLSDALVLAICGGPELLERTQKAYFERLADKTPYLRLLQSVVTGDLEDVVHNADLADWQEIVVVLCTFARPDEFGRLCEALGNRLEELWIAKQQTGEANQVVDEIRRNTVLCYLAAGNLERVVSIWISEQEQDLAMSRGDPHLSEYERQARSLQSLIEKVTVFRKAIDYVDVAIAGNPNEDQPEEQPDGQHKLAALYDKYTEYAEILAAQGRLQTAMEYLTLTPVDYYSKESLPVMRERIYYSGVDVSKVPQPEFPFEPVYVSGELDYQQQQQQQQQQQYQQPQQQQQQQQQQGQYNPYQAGQYGQPPQPQQQQQQRQGLYNANQYQPAQPQNAYGAPPTQGYTSPFGAPTTYQATYQPPAPPQAQVPPPPPAFGAPPRAGEQRPPPAAAAAVPPPVAAAPNPYAPAPPTTTAGPYGGGFSQPPAPPAFGQGGYGGQGQQQQDGGLAPPYGNNPYQPNPMERARSVELPPSQRKDTGSWNDPPAIPMPGVTKRTPAPPANKAQITSPFPGGHMPAGGPMGGTPPPPAAGGPPGGVPPPPMAGAGYNPHQHQHQHQQPGLPPPPMANRGPATSSPYSPVPAASQLPPPPGANPNLAGSMSPRYGQQQQPKPPGQYQNMNAAVHGAPPPPPPPMGGAGGHPYGSTPSPAGGANPYAPPQTFGAVGGGPMGGMASGMPQVLPPMGQQRPMTPAATPAAAPATPPAEPARNRHPAGDRSHIPAGHKIILTVLTNELALARQYANPAAKRPLDDAEKKLNVLFDMLNNEEVSPAVADQMVQLAQALQAKNYNGAYQIHLELHSTRTNEVSAWMTGVKRLIVDNAKLPQ